MLWIGKKETWTLMYKNINLSLFFWYVQNMRERETETERERASGTAKIYTRLRYHIFIEPYFFALSPRGWNSRLNTFNHLLFFFVLGSYSLSTFTSLVYTDISLPVNLESSAPPLHRASTQNGVTEILSAFGQQVGWLLPGRKTSLLYIFRAPTHPSSGIQPTQFKWHFHHLLLTLRHRYILLLNSLNLLGLSKVSM